MKHRKIYSKSDPLIPIQVPALYAKYHVEWGKSNGVVGKVIDIDYVKKTVRMESPSTRIEWKYPVRWSNLRHLRKTQQKLENECTNPTQTLSGGE